MRNNADRFPRPWEGRRPDKSVPQERAASPGTGLFNRGLGAVPPTSEGQVLIHLHRLPVSPPPSPRRGNPSFSISRILRETSLLFIDDSVSDTASA